MLAIKTNPTLTPEAYLAGERLSPIKYELIDGEAYAMIGVSRKHAFDRGCTRANAGSTHFGQNSIFHHMGTPTTLVHYPKLEGEARHLTSHMAHHLLHAAVSKTLHRPLHLLELF